MQEIKDILDWFKYHNKNLTKAQEYKLYKIEQIIKNKEVE